MPYKEQRRAIEIGLFCQETSLNDATQADALDSLIVVRPSLLLAPDRLACTYPAIVCLRRQAVRYLLITRKC